ncbi:phage major tail tube protein [Microbulbifer sp. PSTR4-B]|uniref:phage major tail tube protein n=1 Tax=unclassified Microbulbifer TaxID=2619833 RepID=UPI00403AF2D7
MQGHVFKDMELFADGRGYAGLVEEFEPPTLKVVTEDFNGGGMAAPIGIDMGRVEKLEASWTLGGYHADTLVQWGKTGQQGTPLTLRAAAQSEADGSVVPVVIKMRGLVRSYEAGTHKPGEINKQKYTAELRYYSVEIDGRQLIEIDVLNGKRVVDGVDQTAEIRAAIGR